MMLSVPRYVDTQIQELRGAGLQISEPYTSHGTCLLSLYRDVSGASYHKAR